MEKSAEFLQKTYTSEDAIFVADVEDNPEVIANPIIKEVVEYSDEVLPEYSGGGVSSKLEEDNVNPENNSNQDVSVAKMLLAITGLAAFMLAQRGGSLKNIKANLSKQGKANAIKPMSAEQKKLRRRKRKR